jgi:hypothetical protein
MSNAYVAILDLDTDLREIRRLSSQGCDLISMQSITHTDQMKVIIRCLLEEIQDQQRQIFPDHAPTFNNSLKNKIILIRQILRIIDRYPSNPVKELLYLIDCKIEGEKFLLDFSKTVDFTDLYFDNVENLQHIRFLVRKAGNVKWED